MKAGDIVLVKFPFANLTSSKKRPALILKTTHVNPRGDLVTIAMITSQIDGLKLKGDILPRDWKQSGLLHPSIIRLTKIATLDSELIEKKLGTLSAGDSKEFAKSLREHFSHWLK